MSTLTLRYFAAARDQAGCETEAVPCEPGDTVKRLRERVVALHPPMVWLARASRFARDDEFLFDDEVLQPGDEVLMLPPASGGAPRAQLVDRPIETGEAERLLETAGAGGIATFVGVVRHQNLGKEVSFLEYSAYPPLAVKEMERICEEAVARFGLIDARILHRVGHLEIGEVAVAIGVAAPHRKEAFTACAYVIDEVKARVPIWKKEVTADGQEWLGSTP